MQFKMLSKNKRIPRKLFKPLLESKKYLNSQNFSLRMVSANEVRVAVSVSKKVSKKAVVRNKIRRRAYSIVREFIPQLSNKFFLLIAKPGAERVRGETLKNELGELFKKG